MYGAVCIWVFFLCRLSSLVLPFHYYRSFAKINIQCILRN
jgi:hypothetical protein